MRRFDPMTNHLELSRTLSKGFSFTWLFLIILGRFWPWPRWYTKDFNSIFIMRNCLKLLLNGFWLDHWPDCEKYYSILEHTPFFVDSSINLVFILFCRLSLRLLFCHLSMLCPRRRQLYFHTLRQLFRQHSSALNCIFRVHWSCLLLWRENVRLC